MSNVAQATGAPDEAFYKEVGQLLCFVSDGDRSVVADPASSGVGSVLEFSRTEELRLVTPVSLAQPMPVWLPELMAATKSAVKREVRIAALDVLRTPPDAVEAVSAG